MSALVRGAVASILALTLGCSGGPGSCAPPTRTSYSSAAQPTGTPGCSGVPSSYASQATVPDPMATFAAGTTIFLPFCHPYYPSSVATCSCAGGGDAGASFSWVCPL
jgi:hypothetical protein